MDDNKIIQILLVVIVILLLIIGVMFLTSSKKEDSKICITSNSTLKEGDSITVKLTDLNNTPIKEGIVEIELLDESGSVISSDSGKMDSKGECKFDLNLSEGEYTVNVVFEGNDNYTGSNVTQDLAVEREIDAPVSGDVPEIFKGATWHRRTMWDDGSPAVGEVYLIETVDGDLWTYDNGEYFHGPE